MMTHGKIISLIKKLGSMQIELWKELEIPNISSIPVPAYCCLWGIAKALIWTITVGMWPWTTYKHIIVKCNVRKFLILSTPDSVPMFFSAGLLFFSMGPGPVLDPSRCWSVQKPHSWELMQKHLCLPPHLVFVSPSCGCVEADKAADQSLPSEDVLMGWGVTGNHRDSIKMLMAMELLLFQERSELDRSPGRARKHL